MSFFIFDLPQARDLLNTAVARDDEGLILNKL